jgi:hypothetical protein
MTTTAFTTDQPHTPPRSRRARRRTAGALTALALAAATLAGLSAPAEASQTLTRTGATGYVAFDNMEGMCTYQAYQSRVFTKAYNPYISGVRLNNGSTWQYVIARLVSTDMNTGEVSNGAWSSWQTASAGTYTKFPDLTTSAPWNFEKEAQTVQVWWYDPVSKSYTGYAEILLTRLGHVGQYTGDSTMYSSC